MHECIKFILSAKFRWLLQLLFCHDKDDDECSTLKIDNRGPHEAAASFYTIMIDDHTVEWLSGIIIINHLCIQ